MALCFRCFLRQNQVRWISIKRKVIPEFDANVQKNIENESVKLKKHPGVLKFIDTKVPEKLLDAIKHISRDKPIKTFIKDGEALSSYLEGRHPPLEEEVVKENLERFTKKIQKQYNIDIENATSNQEKLMKEKVQALVNKYTYNWKPLTYNSYLSFVYLLSRTAPEYSTMCRVFNEIHSRDKTFKPQSIFDFGSGVGTVSWAAKHFWSNSLQEFYCIDISSHMNDIAQGLLQKGEMGLEPPKGVYFRQFLPSQHTMYDVVVTAFTLFELPSRKTRLDTIINLWNKTRKYLVIVEQGTNSGFKLVTEARDFILLSNKVKKKNPQQPEKQNASVFAPCSHDKSCPRLIADDNTPCNFEVNYNILPLDNKERLKKQRFSYVILKKGSAEVSDRNWPRLVRHVKKRSGHVICQFCTAEGKLEEIVLSAAKHGKIPYRCARASKWGDLFPAKLTEKEIIIEDAQDLNYSSDRGEDDNSETDDRNKESEEK